MKESQAVVQRARTLDGDYHQLELAVSEALANIQMGQAMLVRPKALRTNRVWHPYLREVWYPVYVARQVMTVEVHTPNPPTLGDVLDVVGPIGQNYRLRPTLRSILLLAYNTPPFALRMPMPYLLGNNVDVTLVLLGTAADYPTRHLPPEIEVIHGDDPKDPLAWHNQVTTIGMADQALAVVPPGDELAQFERLWALFNKRRADIGRHYLYGVFQGLTPCGVGACEACAVRTKDGVKLACVDGPALDLSLMFG
jgi:hypothetical protein